jgi:LysM repeat protein
MNKLWDVFSFFKGHFQLIKLSIVLFFLFSISQIITTSIKTDNKRPDSRGLPAIKLENPGYSFISRQLKLETNIPARSRSTPTEYLVEAEDSISSIAEKFKLTPETILFANQKLEDDAHNLRSDMILIIPPASGIYYAWRAGDTLEEVSEKFHVHKEEITNFTGNKIDLTTLEIKAGTMIMIPGGIRDSNAWMWKFSDPSPTYHDLKDCSKIEQPIATNFTWPKGGYSISGNEYSSSHLGLDIQANEGEPIYAAGAGMILQASSGWNYGYGNVVQIDHGNGYSTIYAFLNSSNVSRCDIVNQGDVIGRAGVSEYSPHTYFHFEILLNGSNINPYEIIQQDISN